MSAEDEAWLIERRKVLAFRASHGVGYYDPSTGYVTCTCMTVDAKCQQHPTDRARARIIKKAADGKAARRKSA